MKQTAITELQNPRVSRQTRGEGELLLRTAHRAGRAVESQEESSACKALVEVQGFQEAEEKLRNR